MSPPEDPNQCVHPEPQTATLCLTPSPSPRGWHAALVSRGSTFHSDPHIVLPSSSTPPPSRHTHTTSNNKSRPQNRPDAGHQLHCTSTNQPPSSTQHRQNTPCHPRIGPQTHSTRFFTSTPPSRPCPSSVQTNCVRTFIILNAAHNAAPSRAHIELFKELYHYNSGYLKWAYPPRVIVHTGRSLVPC